MLGDADRLLIDELLQPQTTYVGDGIRQYSDMAELLLSSRCADEGARPTVIRLSPGVEAVVGREHKCNVILSHPASSLQSVSRRHLLLQYNNERLRLRDTSSYGTFVNGAQVGDISLRSGDVVTLGGGAFEYTVHLIQQQQQQLLLQPNLASSSSLSGGAAFYAQQAADLWQLEVGMGVCLCCVNVCLWRALMPEP